MTLDNLELNSAATIVQITADKELKHRFNSFGVVLGANVQIKKQTISKNTMEIVVNNNKIALRVEEANKIIVTQ